MKPKFFDFIKRWRHTLGYGVHSPLAYRIVRECIHPDREYCYYADSIIRSDSDSMEMRVQLRLTVRLINTLHLNNVWIPECHKRAKRILLHAYPSATFHFGAKYPGNTDFIVFFSAISSSVLTQISMEYESFTILIFHPDAESCVGVRNATLSLLSRNFSLYLRRPGMAPISYAIL